MGASVWDSVLNEFSRLNQQGLHPGSQATWAQLLEPKIKAVFDLTGIPLIIYASACTSSGVKCPPVLLQIDASDKIPFRSMLEALSGPKLDVLIHSPGGYAEAIHDHAPIDSYIDNALREPTPLAVALDLEIRDRGSFGFDG
jgi:hypothetical protein